MIEILIPTKCPACQSLLDLVKDQLFCRNSECDAQNKKSVEHYCKTLKIKGLGPMSIKKLNITNIIDLYELSEDYMASILGDKTASNISQELARSSNAYLNDLLPAFGIPLIGRTASEKLCRVIAHISEVSEETCSRAGLGPKATYNLVSWYEDEFQQLKNLPFTFKSKEQNETNESLGIVCISGKLSSYKTKAEAKTALESAGYTVKPSVTKATTHLINESGIESLKTKKARDAGIIIIENITNLIG